MQGILNSFWRAMRSALREAAGGICAYCSRPTTRVGPRKGTVDHYLPRKLGGTHEIDNLRWCCITCNSAKGDMHPVEWERKRAGLVTREVSKAEKKADAWRVIGERMREAREREKRQQVKR